MELLHGLLCSLGIALGLSVHLLYSTFASMRRRVTVPEND
jgi:threonine/homoserine/homoserine lactone efflux protein